MHICYTYTFQIMKLILILDKENQTKHTVRILNDDFVYWGGKSDSDLPGPARKCNCPLNLITGCATLGSKNYNQMFAVT